MVSEHQAFLDVARADLDAREKAIGASLLPVGTAVEKLERAVQEVEVQRTGAYASLVTLVGALQDGHKDLQREASRLVQALRAPAPRGRWGEIQLRRLIGAELSGIDLPLYQAVDLALDISRARRLLLIADAGAIRRHACVDR